MLSYLVGISRRGLFHQISEHDFITLNLKPSHLLVITTRGPELRSPELRSLELVDIRDSGGTVRSPE